MYLFRFWKLEINDLFKGTAKNVNSVMIYSLSCCPKLEGLYFFSGKKKVILEVFVKAEVDELPLLWITESVS